MTDPVRVSPKYVHDRLQAGAETLLVCAYEDDEKYRQVDLDGSISFSEFRSRLGSTLKDQEIVFYCA